MNGKKAFKVFPDIAGNAMDYFFNRNVSILEKFIVGIVIMVSVFICTLPDMVPFIDEAVVLLLFNTFFIKRVNVSYEDYIDVDYKVK